MSFDEVAKKVADVCVASMDSYAEKYCRVKNGDEIDLTFACQDCLHLAIAAEECARQRGMDATIVAGSAEFIRKFDTQTHAKEYLSYQYTEVEDADFGGLVTQSVVDHLPEMHCWVVINKCGVLDLSSPLQCLAARRLGHDWNAPKQMSPAFVHESFYYGHEVVDFLPRWLPNWQATLLAKTLAGLIRAKKRREAWPKDESARA